MCLERLAASTGSAIGNLLLFVGIGTLWPGLSACPWTSCDRSHPYFFPLPTFEPFIADYGSGAPEASMGPDCPDPQARSFSFTLDRAPLPPAFDPFAYPEEELFACVLVGPGGEPLAVRLIGVGSTNTARQLAAMIREQWWFSRRGGEVEQPAWVRARLNSGPMSEAVIDDMPD